MNAEIGLCMGQEIKRGEPVEEYEERPAVLDWLAEGPRRLIDWLGENEIRFGRTVIETEKGALRIATGVEPVKAAMPGAGIISWWGGMPTVVKYGAPAAALLLLLRR